MGAVAAFCGPRPVMAVGGPLVFDLHIYNLDRADPIARDDRCTFDSGGTISLVRAVDRTKIIFEER
jgi:hypothetical protein